MHRDLHQPLCSYPNTVSASFCPLLFLPEKKVLFSFLVALISAFLLSLPCIVPKPWGREENIRPSLRVQREESGRAGMSCASLAQWALIPISITQLR